MAQTHLEAMAQIALTNDRANIIDASVDDFEEFHCQITRMTHSAVAFLERESGIPRRRAGGDLYMPASIDPWQPTESAAAA